MGSSKKILHRIKTFYFLILVFIFMSTFPQMTTNIHAIQVGEYLVCNFDDRTNGETSWDEYAGGEVWLNISADAGMNGVSGGTDKYYSLVSSDGKQVDFNLVNRFTSIFNWSVNVGTWSACAYYMDYSFKRSNGDQILKLRQKDGSQSACYNAWVVYDSDNSVIKEVAYSGCVPYAQYSDNVRVTFNYTTEEVNVFIDNHSINEWFAPKVFDYVSTLTIWESWWSVYGPQVAYVFDDFKILGDDAELPILWDIDQNSQGCANCEYSGYFDHSFATTNTIVDETNFDTWTSGYMVYQVALGISSNSNIDNITTWLKIGDEYLAQRDCYYTYGDDYYILVWENVNLTYIGSSLPLEFKYIDTTETTDFIYPYYINQDHDLDGDIEFKYSDNADNWNGLYDGDYTIGRDLCYQIWYGQGPLDGNLTVNVYNESSPLTAIPLWNITIYNKASKFIYVNLTDQSNPVVINATDYGLGERIIRIGAEGYYDREYYVNVQNNVCYILDAYLPPIVGSQIYCLQVLKEPNEYGTQEPIYDARIKITRYISGIGNINITEVFTGYNGIAYVSLIVGKTYTFNVSATGYHTEYQTITVSPDVECYTFTLKSDTEPPEYTNETVYHECISFTGYISGTKIYMNFIDYCSGVIDATYIVLEIDQITGNSSAIYWWNDTVYSDFSFNFNINTSNDYKVNLYLNHSIFGYVFDFRYFFHELQNITSRTDFDNKFNNGLFNNPLGWSACFGLAIFLSCLFSFGQDSAGVGLIITGFVMLGINSLGITVLGVTICIVIIVLGILVQARRERRKT